MPYIYSDERAAVCKKGVMVLSPGIEPGFKV